MDRLFARNQAYWWVTAFLITLVAGLFFRTYPLRSEWLLSEKRLNLKAENLIRDQLRKQFDRQGGNDAAHAGVVSPEAVSQKKVEALERLNPAMFSAMTQRMKGTLAARHKSAMSFRYLSEADPYYYLSLTQSVIATGKLGVRMANGKFLNPLRFAPHGNPDVINLHPYFGAGLYSVLKILRPGLTLMQAAGLTPLFLAALAIAIYFAIWPLLGMRLFSFWMSSLIFFLSPIVIQRSTLGWYDTDPYSLIFPALVTLTLLAVIRYPRQSIPLALSGGLLTGLFPLFWQGWVYLLPLISVGAFMGGILNALCYKDQGRASLFVFSFIYTLSAIAFAALFLTPAGFWETVQNSLLYSSRVQGGSEEVWPNLLVLVGETGSVTVKKWIYLTSHYGVILLAVLGLTLPILKKKTTLVWSVIVLMALPIFAFSFTAERFAILAVFPLSLLAGCGVDQIVGFANHTASALRVKNRWVEKILQCASIAIVVLTVIPRLLLGAHVSGLNSHFIMNDAWYGALTELKDNAPKDSIVHSWWPPGYFVNAVSGLKTIVDGGSHHRPENFWMAKAFMARDEATALGLFRMLSVGGNQAMDFLEDKAIRGDQAVELLLKMVSVERAQAVELLPTTWSFRDKAALLMLTHGEGELPPAYVLVYEDMLEQNLAMQVVDGWSFDRAKQVFAENALGTDKLKVLFQGRGAAAYTQKMLKVTGKGLPYEAPAGIASRKDGRINFSNGVTFDSAKGISFFNGPKGPIAIRSIFKKNDQWAAVVPPIGNSSIAALIIPDITGLVCVTAHSDLVRSLLFKLAYLEGQGLSRFELAFRQGSILGKDYVSIYRINWDA